jgi:hypothetical protein
MDDLSRLDSVGTIAFATADNLISGMLTAKDIADARDVAERRQISALRSGKQDKYGRRASAAENLRVHLLGAFAELAAARALGVSWDGPVDTYKTGADIGDFIQVRGRSESWHEMIVRPDDQDHHTFFLVTANLDVPSAPLRLTVRGWLNGGAAKQRRWWDNKGGRDYAYWVPQQELQPMAMLREP